MNRISDHPHQPVAALCKRHAQSPQGKEPEAHSTWHGRLARSLFLLTTLILPATAQLDTSGTGMSDVWERHFNNGNLFDPENPAHHPEADPDGDGWTNFQESIAGTDPFSGNPPDGMVATLVSHLKDQEEEPSLEYPDGRIIDIAVISWETLPGKQYILLFSPDLAAESWLSASNPITGDGQPAAFSVTLTDGSGLSADKLFWRVEVEDPHHDSDGDGLTDYEEYLLGSDPDNPDTSGDGVPDGWLVTHGFNPYDNHENVLFGDSNITVPDAYNLGVQSHPDATLEDLDGDGVPNIGDADPNDREINWEKSPETRYVWIEQVEKTGAKAVSKHGHILFPGENDGSSTIAQSEILWDSITSSWVDLIENNSWNLWHDDGSQNGADVFDYKWYDIIEMNDDGAILGRSENYYWIGFYFNIYSIMKWEISGGDTSQYGSPTYAIPSSTYYNVGSEENPISHITETLFASQPPRIADDGTVSAMSYDYKNDKYKWVTKNIQIGNHTSDMTEWATFDPITHNGAVLDSNTGLVIKSQLNPPSTILHYRDGGDPESLEGLLPDTTLAISDTDISSTPATEGNEDGRVWFSVNQDSGNSVFLEKRDGGSGVTRWHSPPSMSEGAIRLNALGEAITPTSIWRNAEYADINELAAKPEFVTITKLIDLASNGIILAEADDHGVAKSGLLLPVDQAPDLLASNGNFNEGATGSISAGITGAIADNRNETLIAARDSVDGQIKAGDIVTNNLHKGWFGLRPETIPENFYNDALVTITKIEIIDPNTGEREKGQVRFFATWDENEELLIQHDDPFVDSMFPNNPAPRNLVGTVYGSNKTVPNDAKFWIEGVSPGLITLEWRLLKGEIDVSYRQTFEVGNHWSKEKWQNAVRDEIYLDSFTSSSGSAMNSLATQGVDITQYAVANDFLPNRKYIYSVYEYYAKLHRQERTKFLWAGLAKLAGAPVYAGLSDAQNGRTGIAIATFGIIDQPTLRTIQDILIQANINIYDDLAYQFVAYRTGGMKSIEYLFEQGVIDLNVRTAWQKIDSGTDVSLGNQELLDREQRITLAQTYIDLDDLAEGTVSWMFSLLAKNPVPGGPSFQSVVPSGNIAVFDDRWEWITNPNNGMWSLWMGMGEGQRLQFSNAPLRNYSGLFNLVDPLR